MKKNKKIIIGSLITVLTLAAGISSAYAYRGGIRGLDSGNKDKAEQAIQNNDYQSWKDAMESGLSEDSFNKMVERQQNQEKIKKTIEDGDYNAWKEAIDAQPKIEDKITADNFDKFSEMHKLMESGDREGAQAIAVELGIEDLGNGMMRGFGGHNMDMGRYMK